MRTVCVRDEWVTYLLAWKTLPPPFCLPSHSKRPESWKTLARNLNGGHSFPPGPIESGKNLWGGGILCYPFLHRYVSRYGTKLHCPPPTKLRNLRLLTRSVAYPRCLSRIPDPGFRVKKIPGSAAASKNYVFNLIPDPYLDFFTHLGSCGRKGIGSRSWIRNTTTEVPWCLAYGTYCMFLYTNVWSDTGQRFTRFMRFFLSTVILFLWADLLKYCIQNYFFHFLLLYRSSVPSTVFL